MNEMLLTALRAILLCLSFFGLCATVRDSLKLNRFIAPAFAACTIICVLMFAGMLHVLKYGFYLLYFGGFAGLIYTYIIRRVRPDWLLIGLFAVFAGYLAWRMGMSHLYISDDFSHWGTAARYLLRFDAFPDGSTTYVTFQSYPLGATSFIYYVARTLGNDESVWLAAQNLLQAILFLPLFAHVQGNRKALCPVLAVLFLVMYKFNRPFASLTVDWLLSFFGFGFAAAILYYRSEPRKALLSALPGLIAVIYIKNSGLFFAAVYIALLTWAAARKSGRASAVKMLIVAGAIATAACAAWSLHVKFSFPAGFETKHAISLSAYVDKLQAKGVRRCLSISWDMVKKWLWPEFYQVFGALFMALGYVSAGLTVRSHPELRKYRQPLFRYLAACIGCYMVWFIMLYAMYIFSMPYAEASVLASFSRYDSTGLLCMVGLALIGLLSFYSRVQIRSEKLEGCCCVGFAAVLLCTAPMLSLGREYPIYNYFYSDLVNTDIESNEYYDRVLGIRDKYNLSGDFCFIFWGEDNSSMHLASRCYISKYLLNSQNIVLAAYNAEEDLWALHTVKNSTRAASAGELLDNQLDGCDAIILMEENAELEAALSEQLTGSEADIPIIRAYQ